MSPATNAAIEEAVTEVALSFSEDAAGDTFDDTVENNTVENTTIDGKKSTEKRCVFPKLNFAKTVKGVKVITHPFLEKQLEAELVFCRLLASEKPFIATHGFVETAWAEFTCLFNKQVDDNNCPIYGPAPMTERYAKDRFKDYVTFVKKSIETTPFRSGCDDEEEPNELQQIIEDLYEQKTSFQSETSKKRNEKAKGKTDCDALRSALLKNYVPKPPPGVDDATFILNIESNVETPSSTSAGSRAPSTHSGASLLEDQYKRRLDVQMIKLENKKVKLDLAMQKAEEKKKEREDRRKQKEFEREEKKKDKEAERAKNQLFMETLVALAKPKEN